MIGQEIDSVIITCPQCGSIHWDTSDMVCLDCGYEKHIVGYDIIEEKCKK